MRLTLFAIALIMRLAAIELSGPNNTSFGDAADYIAHAKSLCERQVYPDRGNLPFFRAPGLPFFIAIVTACHPHEVRIIKYGLAACDAGSAVVIALIAVLLFGRVAGWIAGIAAALHPVFIASVCDIRSEPLFMLLLTLAIYLLLRERERGAGVATALAALTRPSALLCIGLFALYRPRRAGALLTAAILTLAPWIARNYLRYGELIVVNDAGGFSLWRGSAPQTIALAHESNREAYGKRAWEFESGVITNIRVDIDRLATSPNERSREWRRRAIENIRRDPLTQVRWIGEKAWLYWRPFLSPMEYSKKVVIASTVFYLGFYAVAVIGLVGLGVSRSRGLAVMALRDRETARPRNRSERRLALAVVIFLVIMWLAHLPYAISMRLRVPFVDPLMITLAAGELCRRYAHAGKSDRPAALESP